MQGIGRAVRPAGAGRDRRRGGGARLRIRRGSDHFQPWRYTGGHAPFSIAWAAAVGERTEHIRIGTSVEIDEDGTICREYADEVVIAAGAIETPRLLMRSVGAARDLGTPWLADLPGVGRGLSDHPAVMIDWMPRDAAVNPRSPTSWTAALNLSVPGGSDRGDLELLLAVMPNSHIVSGTFVPGPISLRVALQTPESRGVVHAADEPIAVEYDYLRSAHDRTMLRHGVREGLQLLTSPAFAAVTAEINAPVTGLLESDAFADDWIRGRLGTTLYASGTARMGSADDPLAVTDAHGIVHGIERLRINDTSLLPAVPSRGTAATAVFLGERLAEMWRSGSHH